MASVQFTLGPSKENGSGKRGRKDNGERNADRTENLRQAMVDFRAVFEQLVERASEPESAARA